LHNCADYANSLGEIVLLKYSRPLVAAKPILAGQSVFMTKFEWSSHWVKLCLLGDQKKLVVLIPSGWTSKMLAGQANCSLDERVFLYFDKNMLLNIFKCYNEFIFDSIVIFEHFLIYYV